MRREEDENRPSSGRTGSGLNTCKYAVRDCQTNHVCSCDKPDCDNVIILRLERVLMYLGSYLLDTRCVVRNSTEASAVVLANSFRSP